MGGPTRLTFDFPPEPGAPAVRRVFTAPREVRIARRAEDVPALLRHVDAACTQGAWAAGYVAYEAAPAFDHAMRVGAATVWPIAWFGIFDADPDPERNADSAASARSPAADSHSTEFSAWIPSTSRERYDTAIADIREAIGAGAVYQVNHTVRFRSRFTGDPEVLYERLRSAQGRGYHAHLDFGPLHVLSASPELFFQRRAGRVTTRPMKGTRPRGRTLAEDREEVDALRGSVKDRAENLMIVDLMRNDLGRVACVGSVHVPHMFDIEGYRTVWQMTSTIEADVLPGTSVMDLFRALFPSGSVTGAPKIAAMSRIAALEDGPREAYCGAIGFVEPGGDCTFNVAIRTLLLDGATGCATYGAGGGITWDSTPAGEYDEMLAKVAVLTEPWRPFSLLETLRVMNGIPQRVERHLARLRDSAEYFGYAFDRAAVRARLEEAASACGRGLHRLRLLLHADGTVYSEASPLGIRDDTSPPRVAFARTCVHSGDRFLFHKTTNRRVYEARRAERPGAFDVLLSNERGEVTEFTVGNVVVELDGTRWTPPVSCGLLAGTFRAEQLEAGSVRERVLRESDVRNASRVWLVNSVREWLLVRLEA